MLDNAIINIDDNYGKRLYNELMNHQLIINNQNKSKNKNSDGIKSESPMNVIAPINVINIVTYGIQNIQDNQNNHSLYDLYATNITMDLSGMQFTLNYNDKSQNITKTQLVKVSIIGKFNIYNLLAVGAQLIIDGYNLAQIVEIMPKLKPVCGRMDSIIKPNAPLVIVDYAHTPDALYNTLITLQQVQHYGSIYCVFGCGGERDKAKRGLMGQVAVDNADYVIITTDNPRSEVPADIISDIISGIKINTNKANMNEVNTNKQIKQHQQPYQIIEDRKLAIEHVIKNAKFRDIVLIAGKSHETYQEINGVKHHFSDFEIANNAL